jgi:hypothetical protein
MEATITFFFNPIGPKHGMPFRQLDSAFFHQELKQLIGFGDVKVVCALGLFDPPLVHGQRLLAPLDLSGSYLLIIVGIFHLVGLFQELIVDISYVVLLVEPGVLLKPIGLVAHQRQLLRQLAQIIKLHPKQFLSYGRQHPCNGHIGQLIV